MYQDILLTVIVVILAGWFLYAVLARFFYKPNKMISKMSGHAPDFYDVSSQFRAAFQKGDFEQVITLADTLLTERPFETSALSYKAYALFHLKRHAEAKELFLLLDTLPEHDSKKMLDKINEIVSA